MTYSQSCLSATHSCTLKGPLFAQHATHMQLRAALPALCWLARACNVCAVSVRAATAVGDAAHVWPCLMRGCCCAECQVAILGKSVIAVWMLVCFFAGVAYCAYRRTQMREKFGIAGAPVHPPLTACLLCLEFYASVPVSSWAISELTLQGVSCLRKVPGVCHPKSDSFLRCCQPEGGTLCDCRQPVWRLLHMAVVWPLRSVPGELSLHRTQTISVLGLLHACP